MKKLLLLTTAAFSMILSSYAVSIDVSDSAAWNGYMNVFSIDNGGQGGYVFGSAWGAADLNVAHTGGVVTFSPNTNGYDDNPGDAFWQNGDDGAKWMEANYYVETAGNGQTFSFSGNVDSSTLDSRYNIVAVIKSLGSAGDSLETVSISSTGAFSLTKEVAAGNVAQLGFMMTGINANGATDWGNVQISGLSATAVPEPSTYAMIAGLAAFLFVAIRRRK
jgi:hypothetical protein